MVNNVFFWLKETAGKYPKKIAIIDGSGAITYKEYYNKGIAIASEILKFKEMLGIKCKIPIVVFLEKTHRALVSYAGVAYSGNFYSPIDVSLPVERINTMLDILKAPIIITSRKYKNRIDELHYEGECIFYEEALGFERKKERDVLEASRDVIDTDLLYVLFTSGSTGVPKGVCISHRSVVDYIDWVVDTFKIELSDSFGNQAPFYFDNSVLDIFSCIRTGATLYIIPPELFRRPVELLNYLKENRINTIFWVPSALMIVSGIDAFDKVDINNSLKRVLFAGEVMPTKQLNIWRKYLPNVVYANLYGPTEITVDCTCYIVDRDFQDDESLPIGAPCKNTSVIVLDENDNVVRVNQVGELCVRGTSLSMGYYGDLERTKENFVQNPLNKNYEEKLYRTGDLVKYNEKGELIYVCRKDNQIKHLGHRIELGEIETAVSCFEEVTQCCCVYDDIRKRIVLYIDCKLSRKTVNERLKEILPYYMMPGKVISIDSFPLNSNGKIDRLKIKEIL